MSPYCITGIGVVSPIGIESIPAAAPPSEPVPGSIWHALSTGHSGVRHREAFRGKDSILGIGAKIENFEGKQFVKPRKSLKVMCLPIQFGFAAAAMAAEQAKIESGSFAADRKATTFGAEAFYANPLEVADVFRKCMTDRTYDHNRWGEFAMREIEPLWMLKYLPNMVASHVSIFLDAQGPSNSICQGEVSGSLSVIEAIDFLERGAADLAVAGGTGSPMEYTDLVYRSVHRLAKNFDPPESACRPFDANRSGLVLGEGAGAFVLESESQAKGRDAEIIARVLSYSRGFVAGRKDTDFVDTIARLIGNALKQANVRPNEIGHINATGMSTDWQDRVEALAINRGDS